MIHVDLPAAMECVEKSCGARLTVKLALGAMGNFLPRLPSGHGWQIGVHENGALVCRCPEHHALVEQQRPRLVESPS
jgi:hypothetical protein